MYGNSARMVILHNQMLYLSFILLLLLIVTFDYRVNRSTDSESQGQNLAYGSEHSWMKLGHGKSQPCI